ncbi:DUF952 domain-containing protein [Rhodococcus koreensis]|uniref:Uncharacterized conserved protein, DUF952 family n=1 Tax=Rhodococcus koreensis TaxID=99653 RepID=A0A1H4N0Q2_9NOCA|nr:DUF952 domain-containing protein [Rhodococcus koreensis]SEB89020.1 Uncharacterized conserved protein, DUF952 family [Rhodococcus koreensis]
MKSEDQFVHICSRDEWRAAEREGARVPAAYAADGFVHLSTPAQVHLPANRLFAGRTDLVLLRLDPDALGAPVKWEPGVPADPASMLFPHLYGPLPVTAVTAVEEYLPEADGTFPARR